MRFDPHDYPYPSGQHLTYGHRGMVATSQPLAAQIDLESIRAGGNAIGHQQMPRHGLIPLTSSPRVYHSG
jgi:gamma-glutamyltransferase 2. Threonine peptidase. MEROPS family T03